MPPHLGPRLLTSGSTMLRQFGGHAAPLSYAEWAALGCDVWVTGRRKNVGPDRLEALRPGGPGRIGDLVCCPRKPPGILCQAPFALTPHAQALKS